MNNEHGQTEAEFDDGKLTTELQDRISVRIRTLSHYKNHYRKKFVRFSLIVGGVASANAFLVGVSQIYDDPYKVLGILAFLASSAIAFLSVLDGVLKPKDMWARNAETLNQLYDLRERISYKLSRNGKLKLEEMDGFHDEFRRMEKDFFGNMVDTMSETDSGKN